MKKYMRVLFVLFIALCLNGCARKTATPTKVVTRVEITCENDNHILRRRYTQPQKVQKVLDYLRLQESLGVADVDPERLNGPIFRIDVELSDGSHSVYYQRAGRYLSKKYHPWQKIDPEQAVQFYQMLQLTPTDA